MKLFEDAWTSIEIISRATPVRTDDGVKILDKDVCIITSPFNVWYVSPELGKYIAKKANAGDFTPLRLLKF